MVWFLCFTWYLQSYSKSKKQKISSSIGNFPQFAANITHNVMTMAFVPTAIIWAIFWIISSKNYKSILNFIYSTLVFWEFHSLLSYPCGI